jgi:hypothetical protein
VRQVEGEEEEEEEKALRNVEVTASEGYLYQPNVFS